MRNIPKIVGNILRTRESLSKSLGTFREHARASQNIRERFARMRELLKTFENVSHVCESLSKHLGTFRTHAKASQNIWERFARMRKLLKTFENVSHACASFSKHLRTFRTRAKCYKSIKNENNGGGLIVLGANPYINPPKFRRGGDCAYLYPQKKPLQRAAFFIYNLTILYIRVCSIKKG